jgi:hypothetical protein|tara:strand:+ start:105 stop:422 length:318 start_codon:yes stop_codon:yes gene_type:complete
MKRYYYVHRRSPEKGLLRSGSGAAASCSKNGDRGDKSGNVNVCSLEAAAELAQVSVPLSFVKSPLLQVAQLLKLTPETMVAQLAQSVGDSQEVCSHDSCQLPLGS